MNYINEFYILESLFLQVNQFIEKDKNYILEPILKDITTRFKKYSESICNEYKTNIEEFYKNDIEGLKIFIGRNLSCTASKTLWFHKIINSK